MARFFWHAFFARFLLMEELKGPLLRLEALLVKTLNTTETNRMLLATHNTTLLCLH